jgi:hypothetical protein
MLRPTVSRPVHLGIQHPSGAYDHIFIPVKQMSVHEGTLPDERAALSFTIAAGPRQRTHSRVRVPHTKFISLLLFVGRFLVTALSSHFAVVA